MAVDYYGCALSAERAKIAYLEFNEVSILWQGANNDEDKLVYHVFKGVNNVPTYYHDDGSDVNVYSWIQEKTLHIVFRGTKGLADVKIDLMELQSMLFPGNKTIKVHDGFLKQFNSVQQRLLDCIYNSKGLIDTVHFSGHSLGGALATIAAGYFSPLIRDMGNYKIVCHTIGSPRVGNQGFVDWWSGKVDESVRIVNFRDPVPLLPVNGFYAHIRGGLEIFADNVVRTIGHDLPWYIRCCTLPCNIDYKDPIGNHDCDLYVKRLLSLAPVLKLS